MSNQEARIRVLTEALMGVVEMARMELASPHGRLQGSGAWTQAVQMIDDALAGRATVAAEAATEVGQ